MNLASLHEAHYLGHDVLINASGLVPKELLDAKYPNMLFLKGQTIVIKSDYDKSFMLDDGKD